MVSRIGKPRPKFEQFIAIRSFQPTLTFTPDERHLLFVTNISGQYNLWRTSVRGGWPEQLTSFEEHTVRSATISPDGEVIVFNADRHGDEFHQIYSLPVEGGWPEAWTDEPEVQHFVHQECWSPDGDRLAFAANSRVQTDMDVWVRDAATGEVQQAFGEDMYSFPASWSPDGKKLLALDFRQNTDQSLHLVEAASKQARELTPHDGEVKFLPGPWARDGSGFFMVTDEGRDFAGLAFYDLAERSYEWIETPDWDIEEVAGSADGRYLAWLVNEGGWSQLHIQDLESDRMMPGAQLPRGCGFPLGTALTLSSSGRYAALIWREPRRSAELYLIDVATGRVGKLTDSMLGGLREKDLVVPELVKYPTFDGREVPAWLYRPLESAPVPAILAIHGGPESQVRPWYYPLYHYLASRGLAVLAPNIRGSTGYGKTYQKLIHHDWGGGDLKDFEHAAKWLQSQEWVDVDRIGVFGGSYGGFATLSCVTRLPQYWAAAVEFFGPSNLVTFAKAVPPTWKRFMAEWVGDPETEADFLMDRSPITYVEKVVSPLLVVQGATDPRVVKGESDQMVEKLQSLGREVEYIVLEDEGHGFTKRKNEVNAWKAAADFFERHLLSAP